VEEEEKSFLLQQVKEESSRGEMNGDFKFTFS
jgi:hypothetical protein